MSRESGQVLDVRVSVFGKFSPVCLLQVESSAKGNCSWCDNCVDVDAYRVGSVGLYLANLLALVSNVVERGQS